MSQDETLLVHGISPNGSPRWGDYNSMNVDPIDDCTFWFTAMWADVNGFWSTRIGSFRFSSCDP